MGLSLTAKLVQAHGGHIAGENRRDRSGACFSVSLPLA
jgi:signal transduction histidine kinase